MKLWLSTLAALPLLACHPDEEAQQRNFSSFQPEDDVEMPIHHATVAYRVLPAEGFAVRDLSVWCQADAWEADIWTTERVAEASITIAKHTGGFVYLPLSSSTYSYGQPNAQILTAKVPIFEDPPPSWEETLPCEMVGTDEFPILAELRDELGVMSSCATIGKPLSIWPKTCETLDAEVHHHD